MNAFLRLWSAALLLAVLVLAAPAQAAKPPVPDGSKPLPAGQLPHECTSADVGANSYGPTLGYYWDTEVDQWVSAPRCYPRWGNLQSSGSKLVNAGASVTVTAIPTDGSNSADYAPETKSITWTYGAAKRVSGCGNTDLSCTVIPAKKATETYQWVEIHVTMPRTFFVDSPGSNCAGQHLCGGATTNAWAFAGVKPERSTPSTITGRVVDGDGDAMPGVKINASGPSSGSAATDAEGRYEVKVKKAGKYEVKATNGAGVFSPKPAKVQVRKSSAATANFKQVGCSNKAKDAKAHLFHYSGAGAATGSASFDDCSQEVSVTWTRSVPCTDRAGAPAAPITVTAVWGEGLKPPLKAGSKSSGRTFASPGRLSQQVTIAGQAPGETLYSVVRLALGSIRGSAMRFGVVANVGSGQRVCSLDVDGETLFADD